MGIRRAWTVARDWPPPARMPRTFRAMAARALPTRALTTARRPDDLTLAFCLGFAAAGFFRRTGALFVALRRRIRVAAIRKV